MHFAYTNIFLRKMDKAQPCLERMQLEWGRNLRASLPIFVFRTRDESPVSVRSFYLGRDRLTEHTDLDVQSSGLHLGSVAKECRIRCLLRSLMILTGA